MSEYDTLCAMRIVAHIIIFDEDISDLGRYLLKNVYEYLEINSQDLH